MSNLFFYGTLCHPPLLDLVLGRAGRGEPARLSDHAAVWAEGQAYPMIVPTPGAVTQGILLRDVTPDERARLDFYEGGFGYHTRRLSVQAEDGPVVADVYFATANPGAHPGAPWALADWQARWGDTVVATAADFMALMGQADGQAVRRRYGQMLVRGASRVRAAQEAAPTTLRRAMQPGDVQVARRRTPYAHFFAVEEYDLTHARFAGGPGPVITRAAFVSGDAVTVLPYDPARDRVLLVEQFRAGPYARGDRQPWQLEAIAGRVDPGETPEQTARREAVEEAGLTLGALHPVGAYYPSPGAKTEFLYSYVALCDLPDGIAGLFGLAEEAEDIRGHLVPFDRLMDLCRTGEVANGPLLLTALWLDRERPRLRAGG